MTTSDRLVHHAHSGDHQPRHATSGHVANIINHATYELNQFKPPMFSETWTAENESMMPKSRKCKHAVNCTAENSTTEQQDTLS